MKNIVIIGGGATGTGIAAEAATRGFAVTLIERGSLGSGTSGSFHGMLHSGARYAVNDLAVAAACYLENQRLRQLIPSAILDTGGLFAAFTDTEVPHADTLLAACRQAGIPAQELSVQEALRAEPGLNTSLKRAIRVPDATIDGAEVIRLNKQVATDSVIPARFMTNHEVVSMGRDSKRITSLSARDMGSGEIQQLPCDYVVNAGGVWAGAIAQLAQLQLNMVFDKGTMIVLEKQYSGAIINRCRPEGDGDLLVPFGGHTIVGTTARIAQSPDDNIPTQEEADVLMKEAAHMIPDITTASATRIYAGVRPLFRQADTNLPPSSRAISRSFRVIDHAAEGVSNMMSVVGGKVTLYRLMAEQAVDLLESTL